MKSLCLLFVLLACFMIACEPSSDEILPHGGDGDFTRFITLGDSYIAGYADGELYRSGQQNSLSNILALQLQTVGAGNFKQPLMFDEYGFGKKKILGYKTNCEGAVLLSPVTSTGIPNIGNFINISGQGPYQNLGVHGAKSFHLLSSAYGDPAQGNLYYIRFASEPGYSTMLGDAVTQNPSFFLLGIGTYDILRYAISGGTQDSITSVAFFRSCLNEIAGRLTENGSKGIILNIPDLTRFPYFTTMNQKIPFDGLSLSDDQAREMNSSYHGFETTLASMGITYDYPFTFHEGKNAFIMQDLDIPLPSPFNVRQMTSGDLFLLNLPVDSILCYGWCIPTETGPNPIPQQYVLAEPGIEKVKNALQEYNLVIKEAAQTYQLMMADISDLFRKVDEEGVVYSGIEFNSTFISGGFYSLDGIRLSQRGNAVVSNYLIDELNEYFSAAIPKVNIGDYQGIIYP